MATPESSTPADTSGFSGASELLDMSRDLMAKDRAQESTTMRSQGKTEGPSFVEQTYFKEENARIIESVRADVAEHPELTKADLIHNAAERLMAGRLRLEMADLDAHQAKLEAQGKGKIARFFNKYRRSHKARLAIAVGATAGAVALAASGMWIPALAVKAGSGVLRAGATYFGAREAGDKLGNMHAERKERKLGPLVAEAGRLHVPEGTPEELAEKARQLAADNPFEAVRRLAMFESPHIKSQRSGEKAEQADAWKEALRTAELQRIEEGFRGILDRTHEGKKLYFKKDVPDALQELVHASLSESLVRRQEQIIKDKKSLRIRKGAAVALATVAGVSGVGGMFMHGAEGGSAGVNVLKDYKERVLHFVSGDRPRATDLHTGAAHHTLNGSGESEYHGGGGVAPEAAHGLHDYSFEAGSGDSYWSASASAMDHMDKVYPDARHLGHARRLLATDYMKDWMLKQHGGSSLVEHGQNIKVPKEVMKNALDFAKNYKM